MKKQPERTGQTKQMIAEAFCMLYSEKPIEKITVQEIARGAGVNRSTFYQHFLDIDDLLSNVETDLLDFICKNRERTPTNSDSFIHSLVDLYETKSIYINALLGEYGSARFLERIKVEPKLGILEFSLPDSNIYKPYYIEYHLSTTISLFRLWLKRGKDLPLADFMELTARLFHEGMPSINI